MEIEIEKIKTLLQRLTTRREIRRKREKSIGKKGGSFH